MNYVHIVRQPSLPSIKSFFIFTNRNSVHKLSPGLSLPTAPGYHHSTVSLRVTFLGTLLSEESYRICPSVTGLVVLAQHVQGSSMWEHRQNFLLFMAD